MELNMKKKLLCFALLAGLGMAQAAAAQTYDDRWYVGAGVGVFAGDKDRDIADDVYGMVGVGKMVTSHIAIDAELWHTNADINLHTFPPDFGDITGRKWELTSLSIVGRYFFTSDERKWSPYIVAGIGAQEHHDGTIIFHTFPAAGFNPSRTGTDVNFMLGLGAQFDLGYPYVRTELGVRYDTDDGGDDDNSNGFYDPYAGIEFIFPIGEEAAPPPPVEPPPPAKTCADLDDDGDGVNNCDDKCPAQAGVAPDGCPAPPPEPVMEPKPFRG
jgi:OOP family OmpA-OmpF porin